MAGILNQLQKQDAVESFHYRTALKKKKKDWSKCSMAESHVATLAAK